MPNFKLKTDHYFILSTAALIAGGLLSWHKGSGGRRHVKPQALFTKVLADNSDTPFQHRSRKAQAFHELHVHGDKARSDAIEHPFSKEVLELARDSIQQAASSPSEDASLPQPITSTQWEFVDTVLNLEAVAKDIKVAAQIAVDLEHHAVRSYLGITCLLQISTGSKEYLIDALALHDHMHLLQDSLEDASIVKVLHGGENDIMWLQRDFHIYLVNVFDTEKACQVLGYEERSLAHLLHKYCGIAAEKQHQRADWRVRPLPQELQDYARTDVHYLLYIADVLRAELAAKGQPALEDACRRSHVMSLSLYSKPTPEAAVSGAVNALLRKHAAAAGAGGADMGRPRLADCVHVLCRWRNRVAQDLDESPQWIVPDRLVLDLARSPPRSSRNMRKAASHEHRLGSLSRKGLLLLKRDADKLCALLEEAQLGMHPWRPGGAGAAAAAGKQRRTAEEAAERRRKLVASFCAKSPVYENCRMLSMEGAPLSFIDLRKLKWYEARGLAERVSNDPPTIRLLFRHRAADQVTGADAFYGERKLNCCVACGCSAHYLRYRVVPACYRRNFPVHMKSHRSHDVVLLCFDCHQTAHQAAERMKQAISREYGIPLQPPVPAAPHAQAIPEKALHPNNIRRAALALQHHAATMPAERRQTLTALVRAYVRGGEAAGSGQESLAEEELQEGLMAGFGARARRKHMQRHAAMPSACVRTGTAADGATGADGVNARSEAAPLAAEILHLGDIDQPPANGCADGSQSGVPGGKSARVSGADSLSSSSLPAINRLMELEQGPDSSQESENVEDRAVERLGLGSKQSLAAVGARDLNKGGHQWHGRKVVEAALERGGEEELCQLTARFRQCFVDALQPKHLSPSWQIDHSAKRAFGDYSVYSEQRLATV